METDFHQREFTFRFQPSKIPKPTLTPVQFIPATREAIAKYQDEAYPQWLAHCEEVLSKYHRTLQEQEPMPRFRFLAENRGTRPATDALIAIEAQGSFQIKPPAPDDESESLQEKPTALLDSPPSAPSGRWPATDRVIAKLAKLTSANRRPHPDYFFPQVEQRRDPNKFYYKPHRPRTPQDTFCLECDQWRHEDGKEDFEGEFHLPADQDTAEGVLICRIQAENLSNSASKRIPVRITTALVSIFDRASAAVEALAEHSE